MIETQDKKDLIINFVKALDYTRLIDHFFHQKYDLTLEEAYSISQAIAEVRQKRGEKLSGIKIGFTNSSMWAEYNVYAPIFAPMYDTTIKESGALLNLSKFVQPKIEPEIFFRIETIPNQFMSDTELLQCCSHYGQGFELVQSHFRDWVFSATDSILDFGCHGIYVLAQEKKIPREYDLIEKLVEKLKSFSISLYKNDRLVENATASSILDGGPLSALRYLTKFQETNYYSYKASLGQIVTTGSLTAAYNVFPSERWTTKIKGLAFKDSNIEFLA